MPGRTIGIIGGGQLGRMMALAAKEAGFKIAVLDPTIDSPLGQIADIQIVASYDDQLALEELGEVSDVVTFEFENIDYEGLKRLTEIANVPQGAELVRITQNRIVEKKEITAAGVTVANYRVVASFKELKERVTEVGFPCIVKTALGGYDGKGQMKLDSMDEINKAETLFNHSACIVEEFIPFEKEISVIIQRNAAGQSYCLPISENIHRNHILHESIVPARVAPEVMNAAEQSAKLIANYLQLVGTLAVEMFLLENGELLINELAPRPHNSGHYSIEASSISQFHQHIRAICGWSLREPKLISPCVMVNVLGQHIAPLSKVISEKPQWSVHLYGKEEAKHDRKMGHITILTDDVSRELKDIEASGIWSKS